MAVLGLRFCARAFSSCTSGGHSSSRCASLSLSWPLLLWSTGSRRAGSVIVAHGPSHSAACGIFPDQGSNPCALHWQADSHPLRHQGSPILFVYWCIHGCSLAENLKVKTAIARIWTSWTRYLKVCYLKFLYQIFYLIKTKFSSIILLTIIALFFFSPLHLGRHLHTLSQLFLLPLLLLFSL